MATEISTLRIYVEKLGTVQEVQSMLTAIESAYNNILSFYILIDSLSTLDEKIKSQFENQKFFRPHEALPNLLDFQSKLNLNKIIFPEDRLRISKVVIQSPGFWEFVGSLNPLQQIREYLNDRWNRQKDRDYRNEQERALGMLNIMEKQNSVINERIKVLRTLGYSDIEIRESISTSVTSPLETLNIFQDSGQLIADEESRQRRNW